MDKNKKILVTGCAGFMGSHICRELVNQGFQNVYGIDDMSGGFWSNIDPRIKFHLLDLVNESLVSQVIKEIKPEIVYHLAASAHEGLSQFSPISITNRNYVAFINLITNCIKYNLELFINYSSMAVYGNQIPPFSEEMEPRPEDIYGVNKSAMEKSLAVLSDVFGFRYHIFRPHNVIGIGQNIADDRRNVAGIFMNRIMRGEALYIYGSGHQLRSFSGIEYSLPCYIRCMDLPGNEIINIGGKEPVEVNRLADEVCVAMGVPFSTYPRIHLPDRPREVHQAWTTFEKSEKLLGYEEPKYGWAKTIQEMARWAKGLGPKPWRSSPLELVNEKTPDTWREGFQAVKA